MGDLAVSAILRSSVLLAGAVIVLVTLGCETKTAQQLKIAQAQVQRVTEELDGNTTAIGKYIRTDTEDLKEIGPWGTPLQVNYSQGGLAERVSVRSAGPDREFHTADDIHAAGITANAVGIGHGIVENVEEVAAGAAKGFVKGTIAGIKESANETFKKSDAEAEEVIAN
jgi:hypothetical protein